ncbi:MAG: hypothetical protein AAFW84_08205 [Cyanobacteria bacterium J06635_15]
MKDSVTRLDYCQYLLVSQIHYTLTHFADHSERFSHDQITWYLAGAKITPRLVWQNFDHWLESHALRREDLCQIT